jgi:hypothetical protein
VGISVRYRRIRGAEDPGSRGSRGQRSGGADDLATTLCASHPAPLYLRSSAPPPLCSSAPLLLCSSALDACVFIHREAIFFRCSRLNIESVKF